MTKHDNAMTIHASDVAVHTTAKDSSTNGVMTVLMVGALPVELSEVKGGTEAVILNLFAGFSEIPNIRITHVAFTKDVHSLVTKHVSENVVVHFLPFQVPYEIVDYFSNTRGLNELIAREQPDLIHIQEITPQIIRFLRFPKSNIIVTQHGIMQEELKYASGIGQILKCRFKAYVERYVFPLFRNVIFISHYNQKLYPKTKTIQWAQIYNPVNPIFFRTESTQDYTVNSIIYVGVLSRRKNIRIIIEALAELKKSGKIFKLHVVGGFKDRGYEKEINDVVKKGDLREQIIFHGWKSQEDVRKIYENCPIFILPSQQETLPVSIGEAMALGKIVVAADVGGISEMFTDNVSGFLFEKNDLPDLVRVLNTIHDLDYRKPIAERARKEAIEEFHPKLIAENTLQFYREVLASQKISNTK